VERTELERAGTQQDLRVRYSWSLALCTCSVISETLLLAYTKATAEPSNSYLSRPQQCLKVHRLLISCPCTDQAVSPDLQLHIPAVVLQLHGAQAGAKPRAVFGSQPSEEPEPHYRVLLQTGCAGLGNKRRDGKSSTP